MEDISNNEKDNKFKSIVDLDNLKSDYFLQKLFDSLKKNKSLNITKYNKKLQKRLKLSFNDYKEFSQLYTKVEIELKLVDKKSGKFINILDENEKYYHIYFDNSEEEIKKYCIDEEEVKVIKIIIDYQINSFQKLFSDCKCISSIIFKKFFRNNIINMNHMFSGCKHLKELNISNFNTINVTDMSFMFSGCKALKDLNLSSFNTINVTNMSSMFSGCSSLKELDLSNFDTHNVTDMSWMFYICQSLTKLNISNFNVDKVTSFRAMFAVCSDELKEKIKMQNEKIKI